MNWKEYFGGAASEVRAKKLEFFLEDSFKYLPCRNVNRCFVVHGNSVEILERLGIATSISASKAKEATIPKITISDDIGSLVRAELFARLGYSSWSLKQIQGLTQKTSSNHVRARAIMGQCYFEMLMLPDAEMSFRYCAALSKRLDVVEYRLKLAEILAFCLICHKPLRQFGLDLPSKEDYRIRLRKVLNSVAKCLINTYSRRQRDRVRVAHIDKLKWIVTRMGVLDLIASYWDTELISFSDLLDKVELANDPAIVDPFSLAIIYLLYYNGSPGKLQESMYAEARAEYMIKNDARMWWNLMEGRRAQLIPDWRRQTWTPVLEPKRALNYANALFDFTDNHPWILAGELLIWDKEINHGYFDWARATASGLLIRMHKAGAFVPTMICKTFVPISALHSEDIDEETLSS